MKRIVVLIGIALFIISSCFLFNTKSIIHIDKSFTSNFINAENEMIGFTLKEDISDESIDFSSIIDKLNYNHSITIHHLTNDGEIGKKVDLKIDYDTQMIIGDLYKDVPYLAQRPISPMTFDRYSLICSIRRLSDFTGIDQICNYVFCLQDQFQMMDLLQEVPGLMRHRAEIPFEDKYKFEKILIDLPLWGNVCDRCPIGQRISRTQCLNDREDENKITRWDTIATGITSDLYDIVFPTATTGYVCGSDGTILKSVDRGINWTISNTGIPQEAALYSVYFTTVDTGYVVGNFGNFYTTTDGGMSWQNKEITRGHMRSIFFKDKSNGLISVDGALYSSSDKGSTWVDITNTLPQGISGADIKSTEVFFANASVGFLLLQGKVLKTQNGGLSWNPINVPAMALQDIDIVQDSIGYMCAINSRILKSFDRGSSWQLIPNFNGNRPTTIEFINKNKGVVGTAEGEIYSTNDGGNNWSRNIHMQNIRFHKAATPGRISQVFVVGSNGTILRGS